MVKNIFEGKSFASFGEIIQGRLSNKEDFLVTLPIDLWSECSLEVNEYKGPLLIYCDWAKTKMLIGIVLKTFGMNENLIIKVKIRKNIPVGKGFSSSTADLNAAIKALEAFLDKKFSELEISEFFKQVEPHDALMYRSCVGYNHREGKLLNNFNYIPKFKIIVVDFGGEVDTITYNKDLFIPDNCCFYYDLLYKKCADAFDEKNDKEIALCATNSLEIFLKWNKDDKRLKLLDIYKEYEALGVINTHSGTCVGLIYSENECDEKINSIEKILTKEFGAAPIIVKAMK
ncbi:GHMP family kinase ATP-binding protein [Chryseobacterium gallinarum]|uniref:GHMP kinase N-terminal domain-containing protein n=1 Tax=Chryseobacterium gallinarum TaxID=1324352 RepID=A0ABX6KQK6_CHRGL|nr:hypothetical protein [Chryseobacterium gallinarum]QIY90732.1 hypothetical protein FOB44_08645 [Chryseobacterium gallinarum]